MPIDFSKFVKEPAPPVIPEPQPKPAIDYSKFVTGEQSKPSGSVDYSAFVKPAQAPVASIQEAPAPDMSRIPNLGGSLDAAKPASPGFQTLKGLIPDTLSNSPEFSTTSRTYLTPEQVNAKADELWAKFEAEKVLATRWQEQAQATGLNGGPATTELDPAQFPTVTGLSQFANKEQLRNALSRHEGLGETLPGRGVLPSFGAGLVNQLQLLTTSDYVPQVQWEQEREAANFAEPGFGETVASGLGASAPVIGGMALSRGRLTGPLARTAPKAALATEAGFGNFLSEVRDPNVTPAENIINSLLEAGTTRLGGAFEPNFGSGFKNTLPHLAGESGEEALAGGTQDIATQASQLLDETHPLHDPTKSYDPMQTLKAAGVGAVSGPVAASTFAAPKTALDTVKAIKNFDLNAGVDSLKPDYAPKTTPEDVTQTKVDLRPVDTAELDAKEARYKGIPTWLPEPMRDDIAARFRQDERGQIPALDLTPTSEDDRAVLVDRVSQYIDKASSESDRDQNNAIESTLADVPERTDVTTPRRIKMGDETQDFTVDVEDSQNEETPDNSQEETADVLPNERETQLYKTQDGYDTIDGPPSIPVEFDVEDTVVDARFKAPENAAVNTPNAYDEKLAAEQDAEAPTSPNFLTEAGKTAYNKLAPEYRNAPEMKSTLEHLRNNPDPNGEAGNIAMVKDAIDRNKRKAAKQQQTIPFNEPAPKTEAAPAPAPAAPALVSQRGGFKGATLARRVLGPAIAKPVKLPQGFESKPVRVFKDAGTLDLQTKDMDGTHILMYDEQRGKALIGIRTDAKGRPQKDGTEIRPVDKQGKPKTIEGADDSAVPIFNNIEDAISFAGKNLTQQAPASNVAAVAEAVGAGEVRKAGKGGIGMSRQEPEVFEPVQKTKAEKIDADRKRLKEIESKNIKELSDEELDEADALEARIREYDAVPQTSERATSDPLSPRALRDIRDSIKPDMPGRSVGQLVKNILEAENGKAPSREELSSALNRLVEDDIITKDQAIVPGEDVQLNAIGPHDIVKLFSAVGITTPAEVLKKASQDLPDRDLANVTEVPALRPQAMGSAARRAARAVGRLVAPGRAGVQFANWVQKAGTLGSARTVAALYPAFRPVLSLITNKMSQTKLLYQSAYHRLDSFRRLNKEDRFRVNGALIAFRLNDTKSADFGKPVTYTDEKGRNHTFTLTADQVKVVKEVFEANRRLLQTYVDVLKHTLNLPPTMTLKDLQIGLVSGTINKAAAILEGPLRILEEGGDSYVPLKRFGGFKRAVVEENGKRIGFIQAESLADYQRQISNMISANPNAQIKSFEELGLDNKDASPVTAKELSALADMAGVDAAVLQQFLDAGAGDFLNTRGVGARFTQATKEQGFSHDMLRVNASHAKQMTDAITRLAYRHATDLAVKRITGDPILKQYAEDFVERMDTPLPVLAASVRSLTTLFYLAFSPVTSLVNSTSSMVYGTMISLLATRNPVLAAKTFTDALSQQYRALQNILFRGAITGKNQAIQAAEAWDKKDPALAAAIRRASKEGKFIDTYDREAEQVARIGETSKAAHALEIAGKASMHFFSKVEAANRIAGFISGYRMFKEQSGHAPFKQYMDSLGFNGTTPEEMGDFFSEAVNFRMDRVDMPAIVQGSFGKKDGKRQFNPATLRPIIYTLKSWAVNFMQQQAMLLRAAWRGDWIDKALFLAIQASMVAMFGAVNVIPGLQMTDDAIKWYTEDLYSPSEKAKEAGGAARAVATGVLGQAGEALFNKKVGDAIDSLAARVGPGNVAPTSVRELIAPIAAAGSLADSAVKATSEDTETRIEGIGGLFGNMGKRTARTYNMMTGSRGYTTGTGATLVPDESTAIEDAPFISTSDKMLYWLGLSPGIVQGSYREKKLIEDIRESNDEVQTRLIKKIADGYFTKDEAAGDKLIDEAMAELDAWNDKADKENRPYKMIVPDNFKQAVKMEIRTRAAGQLDPRLTPKLGREEQQKGLDKLIPQENRKTK